MIPLKNKGMSLVEVLITSTIAVSIALGVNKWMGQLSTQQRKIEKKEVVRNIKKKVLFYLSDLRAWRNIPGDFIPLKNNTDNLYYYPRGSQELHQLTVEGAPGRGKVNSCENVNNNFCRVILFSYDENLIVPERHPQEGSSLSYFKAIVVVLTENEQVTRNELPQFRITLVDMHKKVSERVLPTTFLSQMEEKKVSHHPVIVADCYQRFLKNYPDQEKKAYDFCLGSRSLAGLECLEKSTQEFNMVLEAAMSVCRGAKNTAPYECLKKMINKNLGHDQVATLCQGVKDRTALECFRLMEEKTSDKEKWASFTKLCRLAENLEPVDCYMRITQTSPTLSVDRVVSLCTQSSSSLALSTLQQKDTPTILSNDLLKAQTGDLQMRDLSGEKNGNGKKINPQKVLQDLQSGQFQKQIKEMEKRLEKAFE